MQRALIVITALQGAACVPEGDSEAVAPILIPESSGNSSAPAATASSSPGAQMPPASHVGGDGCTGDEATGTCGDLGVPSGDGVTQINGVSRDGGAVGDGASPSAPGTPGGGSLADPGSVSTGSTEPGLVSTGSTEPGSVSTGSTDAGVPSEAGAIIEAWRALNGPATLAAGGIALLHVEPEALFELTKISLGQTEFSVDDGERVQFVLVSPELDNPSPGETGGRAALDDLELASLELVDLPLEQQTLSSLPEPAWPLLRVAVRLPANVSPGAQEFRLETTLGATYTWSVEIIEDVGAFVPPMPAGIIWPAISNHDGVFPIGTQGPYDPLVDPIVVPSFPYADPFAEFPLGVYYDFRLLTPSSGICVEAAPLQGLVAGAEHIDGVGTNPIEGFYDVERGNVVEIVIDRTPTGGVPELYRGGWVTGSIDALLNPSERGQLEAPQAGHSFVALRAVRTGLPLVFNYVSTDKAFEEACPELATPSVEP